MIYSNWIEQQSSVIAIGDKVTASATSRILNEIDGENKMTYITGALRKAKYSLVVTQKRFKAYCCWGFSETTVVGIF